MKNLSKINMNHYAQFTSMSELVVAMNENIKVWSWAAHAFTNCDNYFLRFKVNGHWFKGWVYIGVNGKDLFDVFLTNRNKDIVHELIDVLVDDLIDRIDEKVEKLPIYKR